MLVDPFPFCALRSFFLNAVFHPHMSNIRSRRVRFIFAKSDVAILKMRKAHKSVVFAKRRKLQRTVRILNHTYMKNHIMKNRILFA